MYIMCNLLCCLLSVRRRVFKSSHFKKELPLEDDFQNYSISRISGGCRPAVKGRWAEARGWRRAEIYRTTRRNGNRLCAPVERPRASTVWHEIGDPMARTGARISRTLSTNQGSRTLVRAEGSRRNCSGFYFSVPLVRSFRYPGSC